MTAFDLLVGTTLRGVWLDAPEHRVTLAFVPRVPDEATEHVLTLEGVTEFGFTDPVDASWPVAEVTEVHAAHDAASMRLDFHFAATPATITVVCSKVVFRRVRADG